MALNFNFAPDRAPAFGLIMLQTDSLVEPELGPLFHGLGYRTYHNRIRCMPEVHPETLMAMGEVMTETAAMFPADIGMAAIGYACTSGATILGETRVAELIGAAHPGMPVSNPLSGLKAACRALGITKLGLLSPYVANVADAMIASLKNDGVDVGAFASFEQAEDHTVGRIDPRSVLEAMIEVGKGDCEAVFASCTNLRAFEVVEEAEAAIGKPVLCSNQVMAWHMLQIAGLSATLPGRGRIFTNNLMP
tara:strand:- start:3062 stop:3808 length:747 start_codon:yes stop_codon:yes gene_type:complete